MKTSIIYCILFLLGLHLTASGLEKLDLVAHFVLITLLGTTLILPIGTFYILNKEKKGNTLRTEIFKAIILFLVVYLSYLFDNNFNAHTDQVGRYLGKISLITGVVVVCILVAINFIRIQFQKNKKNVAQQGA